MKEYVMQHELFGLAKGVKVSPSDFERQLELETRALDAAVARYRQQTSQITELGRGAELGPAQALLLKWFTPLTEALAEEQRLIRIRESSYDRAQYGHVFLLLPADKLAVIALHELVGLSLASASHIKFSKACTSIGEAVEAELNMARLRREDKAALARLTGAPSVSDINRSARAVLPDSSFHYHTKLQVGAALIKFVLDTAVLDPSDLPKTYRQDNQMVAIPDDWNSTVPAFEHKVELSRGRKMGWIHVHPYLLEVIEAGHLNRAALNPRFAPMIVPPKPWTSYISGGYLSVPRLIMRTKGSRRQVDVLRSAPMTEVLEGLNVLSSTAWKINSDVLDVVREAWEVHRGGFPYVPRRENIPEPRPELAELDAKGYRKEVARVRQENFDLHSLRCDFLFKSEIAEQFEGKTFYFPTDLDFRGRAYPVPPHLNHIGSDLNRGLLKFAKEKPLGASGLYWLKVHLANCFGFDKATMDERAAFAEEHREKILAVASDPLGESDPDSKWWLEGENAWQTLATCFELAAAWNSGDPESHMCGLPVHADGSCNGLQHYSALARDRAGGAAVNLLPSDRPGDLYSDVLHRVNERVDRDAADGDPIAQQVQGKLVRKTIKQTVMTTVYGVTFVGARNQIESQMRDDGLFPEETRFAASSYVAKKTFEALGELFANANEIKSWLGNAAQTIAKAGHPVQWTSPLGLPIVQPYRREGRAQIRTVVQSLLLVESSEDLPISTARQRSAFPPNYIHAVDASHLLMTARACAAAGIEFASVHDSFWSHPCDINTMSQLLREQFIRLHSRPLLEELRDSFVERYPECEFEDLPPVGDLDLNLVRDSLYFFS